MMVTPGFDVGGIEPEIRPIALERPAEKGVDLAVDLLAKAAYPRLRGGRLCDFEMPLMPIALTNSSTERVEMP